MKTTTAFALFLLAHLAARRGGAELAVRVAAGVPSDRLSPRQRLRLAQWLLESRRFRDALATLSSVDDRKLSGRRASLEAACLNHLGLTGQALEIAEHALADAPRHAELHYQIGNARIIRNELPEALAAYSQAIRCAPKTSPYHAGEARAHMAAGRLDEAKRAAERALQLDSGRSENLSLMGIIADRAGDRDTAVRLLREALAADPANGEPHYHLYLLTREQPHLVAAERFFRQQSELNPRSPHFLNFLGLSLKAAGRDEEALDAYQKALAASDQYGPAYTNIARLYMIVGDIGRALEFEEQGLAVSPSDPALHSNRLLTLNYLDGVSTAEVFEKHRQYGRIFDKAPIEQRQSQPEAPRKIRIGYLSGDFKSHSVSYFFEPLLAHHDRNRFEVVCVSNTRRTDAVTERLRRSADHWLEVAFLGDEAARDLIREHSLDVLIDLSGHTADNRLPLLGLRPAPLQGSFLGYPNTTGMQSIDFRITDTIADPPGEGDTAYTERLVRLDGPFLCYSPPAGAPDPAPAPPSTRKGYISFGSFNNAAKISGRTLATWSRILASVPDSRLVIKSHQLQSDFSVKRLEQRIEEAGIDPARVELLSLIPDQRSHLALYHEIDIALDTFPYNGTTTTCEALWMGVPVIALNGDRHAARVSASILHACGLDALVADHLEDYAAAAVELARDAAALQRYRQGLRATLGASRLMKGAEYTRDVEDKVLTLVKERLSLTPPLPEKKDHKRRLHIGAQGRRSGWETLDAIPGPLTDHIGDASDLSRFEDETFDELYASHVLEHFSYQNDLLRTLREWTRVLKTGGTMHISVPDLSVLARQYLDPARTPEERFHLVRIIFGGQTNRYDFHYMGFDYEILAGLLAETGLGNIQRVDDLSLFEDTSRLKINGEAISLNVRATKMSMTDQDEWQASTEPGLEY